MFKKIGVISFLSALSVPAFAALPTSIATDAGAAAVDALALGGIVLGLVVGIAVFKHIRAAK
jgi:hypothetical protein